MKFITKNNLDYEIIKIIDKGSFCIVYKAVHNLTKKKYAIKV